MRADVAIVGGGPAGCFTGMGLAERGFKVVIIEEHGEIGNPECCTGIVGVGGLAELGIKPGKWVLGKLRGAVVHTPSNESIELTQKKIEAFVIDRAEFDRSLARRAAEAGATFLLKHRCVGLAFKGGPLVRLKGEKETEISARVLVGADGPMSIVARKAGLITSDRYIRCAQIETIAEAKEDIAEVFLGNKFSPGFFGWLVKAGDVCRVGLGATSGNPNKMLLSFLVNHPVVSRRIKGPRLKLCAGLIPPAMSRRLCSDNLLLVGDAAGQVKPLTGGGIYIGLSCAKLAVDAVARALESGDKNRLYEYESLVMKKFGREFEFGIRARKMFERMSDEDLDTILGLLKKDEVKEIVLKNFDFDHHEGLIRALTLKAPEFLGSLGLKRVLKYAKLLMKP